MKGGCQGQPKKPCAGCVKTGQLVVSTTTTSKKFCSDGKSPVTVEFTPVVCKAGGKTLVEYVKAVIKDPVIKCANQEMTKDTVSDRSTYLGTCGKSPLEVTDLPTTMCKKGEAKPLVLRNQKATNAPKKKVLAAAAGGRRRRGSRPRRTRSPVSPPTKPPVGTRAPVPPRLECTVQGDPHVAPFIGGNYDLHHTGVFRVLKRDRKSVV